MLKALDIIGFSWMLLGCPQPLQRRMEVGDSAFGLADWNDGFHFKKGDQQVCSRYWVITLLSLSQGARKEAATN